MKVSGILVLVFVLFTARIACADTVALWLFDEQRGVYPSTLLNDASGKGNSLILGRGGSMVQGRFGNALEAIEPAPLKMTGRLAAHGQRELLSEPADPDELPAAKQFGLIPIPKAPGRSVEPMHWGNAYFAALFTRGEKHLRSGGFPDATETKLNIGPFDWTIEFWFSPNASNAGTVFEIGQGPRGENDHLTRLTLDRQAGAFTLYNQPSGTTLTIPSDTKSLAEGWHHYAFVYDKEARELRHYVDGKLQTAPAQVVLKALPQGEEAYFSVGRDGTWGSLLPGRLDELRFSDATVYRESFSPPDSFSQTYRGDRASVVLPKGLPLLFGRDAHAPYELGSRKHVFVDDALIEKLEGVSFVPNPPQRMEMVIDHVKGHLTVVDDGEGLLRLFYQGPEDSLAVMTSRDGVHWEKPDLGREFKGERNIVCERKVGLGVVFIDPYAPPEQRWKYLSGIRRQGIFLFMSPDGWKFEPHETASFPLSAGSQSIIYYDDQRQLYVSQHRSDYGATPSGSTERRFVLAEVQDLLTPWPFTPTTPERTREATKIARNHSDKLDPWFLDNGPLAPCGIGIELPFVFGGDDKLDPVGTDVYVTKALKYPWAPDTYLAFPAMYFHYWKAGPANRQVLGDESRQRGSGVTEVQLAVSRDGLSWHRYPRPAYVPIGGLGRDDIHMMFLTYGMVRRNNEIWQFVGGHGGNGIGYHSAWKKNNPSPLWRLVQRIDGFVAAEGAYSGGMLKTKPLKFAGSRLKLNIDTGAVGYAQVGFLDESGKAIPGYSLDDCVYINGDSLNAEVEWLGRGTDVSSLAGQVVQLEIRLHGARLFAMQFE